MKNIVFLDCEFTDLLFPELLSLGMVSSAGEEHYVELSLEHPSSAGTVAHASEFVRHNGVLEQWGRVPGSTMTREQMGHRTAQWLVGQAERSGRPVYIAHDYAADFELLEQLLRDVGQWELLGDAVQPLDVGVVSGTAVGDEAAERCLAALAGRGLHRHHALADAQALRAAFLAFFHEEGGAQ